MKFQLAATVTANWSLTVPILAALLGAFAAQLLAHRLANRRDARAEARTLERQQRTEFIASLDRVVDAYTPLRASLRKLVEIFDSQPAELGVLAGAMRSQSLDAFAKGFAFRAHVGGDDAIRRALSNARRQADYAADAVDEVLVGHMAPEQCRAQITTAADNFENDFFEALDLAHRRLHPDG